MLRNLFKLPGFAWFSSRGCLFCLLHLQSSSIRHTQRPPLQNFYSESIQQKCTVFPDHSHSSHPLSLAKPWRLKRTEGPTFSVAFLILSPTLQLYRSVYKEGPTNRNARVFFRYPRNINNARGKHITDIIMLLIWKPPIPKDCSIKANNKISHFSFPTSPLRWCRVQLPGSTSTIDN